MKDGQAGNGVEAGSGHVVIIANSYNIGIGIISVDDGVCVSLTGGGERG